MWKQVLFAAILPWTRRPAQNKIDGTFRSKGRPDAKINVDKDLRFAARTTWSMSPWW